MAKIIGIDIGTNSLGIAYIDTDKEEIICLGTYIFPEGVNRTSQGKEVSKNGETREARGKRKQLFRKKLRKEKLLKLLAEHNMMPLSAEELSQYKNNKESIAKLNDWFKRPPIPLRAKAVEEPITLIELGRILYHFCQRRGFLSNSRTLSEEDSKIFQSREKVGISELAKNLKEKQQTLGQYLHTFYREECAPFDKSLPRMRNFHTHRQMYIDEFRCIWENQKKFHPELHNTELYNKIGGVKKQGDNQDGIIFYQRPLKSQRHLVGKCNFEPKKKRIPISHPLFEIYKTYQFVNSITYNGKKLSEEERNTLCEELFKHDKKSLKFSKLIEKIKKPIPSQLSENPFNYNDENCSVPINKTIPQLLEIGKWKKAWLLSDKFLDEIWHALFSFDDASVLEKKLVGKNTLNWDLSPEEAQKFININLAQGYAKLSKKAIRKILPFLKKGDLYDEAMTLAGYHHSKPVNHQKRQDELTYTSEELRSIRNPIVWQALFAIKHYYNKIVDRYGAPDEVRVELTRELRSSKKKREKIQKEQKNNEKERIKSWEEIKALGYEINYKNESWMIEKYRLWKECQETCPYTGEGIPIEKKNPNNLFYGPWEIEHIQPQGGNHWGNKTLCFRTVNSAKGNMIPYDYFIKKGKNAWEKAKNLVKSLLPRDKYEHFIKETREDRFMGSQLPNTAFISRKVRELLYKVAPKVNISKGGVTATLRRKWKLNSILSDRDNYKNRNDHRHHALDALVVAVTKQNHIKSANNARYNHGRSSEMIPMPWEGFRESARKKLGEIIIYHKKPKAIITSRTHKIDKGNHTYTHKATSVRGKLHLDTYYSLRTSTKESEPTYRKRVNIADISKTNIDKIADTVIKEIVESRIKSLGGFEKKNNKWKTPEGAFFKNNYFLKTTNEAGEEVPLKEIAVFDDKKKNKKQLEMFPNNRPTTIKEVESFKKKEDLDNIVDPMLKEKVLARIDSIGGFSGKNLPSNTFYESVPVLYLKKGKKGKKESDPVPIKRVRLKYKKGINYQQIGTMNKYVNTQNNDHMIFYKDDKGNQRRESVTFWETVKRYQKGEKIYQLPANVSNGELLFSLKKGDMFLVTDKSKEEINWGDKAALSPKLYKVRIISGVDILLVHHLVANLENPATGSKISPKKYKKGEEESYPLVLRLQSRNKPLNGFKVKVSLLGEIMPIPFFNQDE